MLKELAVRRVRGFTVIEMMFVVTVIGILMAAVLPSMQGWIRGARVRAVADALQNGLRLAQTEAVRQNRQVVFTLTNAEPALDVAAVANGRNWSMQTVPLLTGESGEFLQGGALSDVASGVNIIGPREVCFNASGAQVVNPAPGPTNAVCAVGDKVYSIDPVSVVSGTDRRLRVQLSIGGRVRMCDRNKTVATSPDGC